VWVGFVVLEDRSQNLYHGGHGATRGKPVRLQNWLGSGNLFSHANSIEGWRGADLFSLVFIFGLC